MDTKTKRCFVIAPIGDPGSEVRERSDTVMKYIIRKAIEPLGYEAIRADEIADPGIITTQVIQHVVYDDLAIVDMTDMNPNVFYELAVRHASGKPSISIIEVGQRIPFDVGAVRTIQVDTHNLASADRCIDEIAKQIRAIEPRSPQDLIETPLSGAINLQQLQQSSNPVGTGIADIKLAVSSLSADLNSIQAHLSTVARASDLPRLSSFSGSGSGTVNHGLGARPDLILLHTTDGSPIYYDSANDATVHVEMPEGSKTYVGIAMALTKPYGFVIQRPTNATSDIEAKAGQAARNWLQSHYPDSNIEESTQDRVDLIVTRPDGTVVGAEVKYTRDPYRVRALVADEYLFAEGQWQKEFIVFLIGVDQIAMEDISRGVARYDLHKPLVTFVVGYFDGTGEFHTL